MPSKGVCKLQIVRAEDGVQFFLRVRMGNGEPFLGGETTYNKGRRHIENMVQAILDGRFAIEDLTEADRKRKAEK